MKISTASISVSRTPGRPLSPILAQVSLVGIAAFLAAYSVFDARALYSDAQEVSPVGNIATVASLGLLAIAALSVVFSLADRRTSVGILQFALFAAFSGLLLARLYHDGLSSSYGTILVLAVLFSVSLQSTSSEFILTSLAWSLRLLLLASVIAVFFSPDWALVPPERSGRELFGLNSRLIGFSASPNYIATAAGLLLLLELFGHASRSVKLRVVSSFLCAVVLLWAQSRSVLFGVTLVIVLYLATRSKHGARRLFVAASWSLIAVSAVLPMLDFRNSTFLGDDPSDLTTGRTEIWRSAASELGQYWLTGLPAEDAKYLLGGAFNAHNQILETLLSGGVLLLVANLALLFIISVLILRNPLAPPLAAALLLFISAQFLFGTPFRVTGLSWNLLLLSVLVLEASALPFTSRYSDSLSYRNGSVPSRFGKLPTQKRMSAN